MIRKLCPVHSTKSFSLGSIPIGVIGIHLWKARPLSSSCTSLLRCWWQINTDIYLIFKTKKRTGKVWKESQQMVVEMRTPPQPSLNQGWQDKGFSTTQRKPCCRKWLRNNCKREQALIDMALAQAGGRWTEEGHVMPSSDQAEMLQF